MNLSAFCSEWTTYFRLSSLSLQSSSIPAGNPLNPKLATEWSCLNKQHPTFLHLSLLFNAAISANYQFIRKGYFCLDKEATKEKMIFNRTVSLKDAWAKEVKKK